MKYARIVNAEYNSEDDLITFIAKGKNSAQIICRLLRAVIS